MTNQYQAVILSIERALLADGWPLTLDYEVTAGWRAGRLLLFIGLDEQGNNADDDKCVLKQFTVCDHMARPLSADQRAKKLPPVRGPTACRS